MKPEAPPLARTFEQLQTSPATLVRAWSLVLVRSLHRAGIRSLWLAPGARSAPLAWAAWMWQQYSNGKKDAFRVHVHFDERGLAFAALGEAQAAGSPVACLTTSGSAVANLFPAVVEAFHAGIPLLLLTADRPPEMRGRGANQTIQQPGIFGSFVKQAMDFPCPSQGVSEKELALWIDHAIAPLRGVWPGPVHLNIPFREPLLPPLLPDAQLALRDWCRAFADEKNETANASGSDGKREKPLEGALSERGGCLTPEALEHLLPAPARGFLVVGALSEKEQAGWPAIIDLAKTLGWPVVADPLAGYPKAPKDNSCFIPHFDLLLQTLPVGTAMPEVIWHLGGAFVSRRVGEFLASYKGDNYVQIRRGPEILAPLGQKPMVFLECPINGVHKLLRKLGAAKSPYENSWAAHWSAAGNRVGQKLQEWWGTQKSWSEPRWAYWIGQWAAELNADLFLGNSMAVRDFGVFAEATGARVLGQRGASGIDGNLAHVAGWAGSEERRGHRLFALLGDLALLHDVNSLALLKDLPVTLLVPNNGGGGIFHFLPLAIDATIREELLETPHAFPISEICAAFGFAVHRVGASECSAPGEHSVPGESPEEILAWIREQRGPALVELPSGREQNWRDHQDILEMLTSHLREQ